MFWMSRIKFDKGLPWLAFGCAAVFFVAPFTWPEGIPFPFQLGVWTLGVLSIAFGLWKSGLFTVSQHELIDTDETISDWPIHELFYYHCPELVERPGEVPWEKVGSDVREKFSMDENNTLGVSGIPIEKDQMENWFSSNTRVPIPHTYWQHADFSYRFLRRLYS